MPTKRNGATTPLMTLAQKSAWIGLIFTSPIAMPTSVDQLKQHIATAIAVPNNTVSSCEFIRVSICPASGHACKIRSNGDRVSDQHAVAATNKSQRA